METSSATNSDPEDDVSLYARRSYFPKENGYMQYLKDCPVSIEVRQSCPCAHADIDTESHL